MPELPEVETSCRIAHRLLAGSPLVDVRAADDPIVFVRRPPEALVAGLVGRTLSEVGRRGKFFWFRFADGGPDLCAHLGMNGRILDLSGEPGIPYKHGNRTHDGDGAPAYWKLLLTTEDGRRFGFTDGRRLARAWFAERAEDDPRVARLGPDAYREMPPPAEFFERLRKRRAPLKAILLDQAFVAGVGNYLADECLYQAGLDPRRLGTSLTKPESDRLRRKLWAILDHAVSVEADYNRFPEDWLFHFRWDGSRGATHKDGHEIVRETIGGRTTAYVPAVQR